jgi:hypothetical protein
MHEALQRLTLKTMEESCQARALKNAYRMGFLTNFRRMSAGISYAVARKACMGNDQLGYVMNRSKKPLMDKAKTKPFWETQECSPGPE